MRLRFLLIPFAVLAVSLAFAACGDDDDDDGGDDAPAATTAPADGGDDGDDTGDDDDGGDGDDDGGDDGGNGGADSPFGSGSAALTIGDESWAFDGIFCAFSTEETQNDNVPFTISAFTTSSTGARAQLDASIVDLSGAAEMSAENLSVTLDDVDDFQNPSVSWSANTFELFGGSVPELEIDGKNVTINAVFDDGLTEDEMEAIPGTLVANCP
jgi:hypothetical protein